MPTREDGKLLTSTERTRPMVKDGDGPPIPLPPPAELHGVGLPGGDMHKPATAKSAGFMMPQHVAALEAAASAIANLRSVFSSLDHDHEDIRADIEKVRNHDHPDLATRVSEIAAAISDLSKKLAAVAARPVLDASKFASAAHDHPPKPLPAHDHPKYAELAADLSRELGRLHTQLASHASDLGRLSKKLDQIDEQQRFTRRLVDETPEPKLPKFEHGQLAGGRMHSVVTDRQAGFMTPHDKRFLDSLREKFENPLAAPEE